jgi:hypothetical protein
MKTIGYCKDCEWSDLGEIFKVGPLSGSINSEYPRGKCHNRKILGIDGDDLDGIYEWEAAETSIGPMFGCIHWCSNERQ